MSEVTLPDIGDFHDVEVIEILVGPGDQVAPEDPLILLESDKASMEIPSPQAGTVAEIRVAVGDRVNKGDLIVILQAGDAPAVDAASTTDAESVELAPTPDDVPAPAEAPDSPPAATSDAGAGVGQAVVRDVLLPDIGEFTDVEIIELLVAPGDSVAVEQSLLTLESDKASMEIPAPFAGVVDSVEVAVGATVNQGDLIARIRSAPEAPAAADKPTPGESPEFRPDSEAPPAVAEVERAAGEKEPLRRPVIARPSDAPKGKAHASPGVRRFARELGVDLYQVPGSGPKQRITKVDVQDYVKRTLAAGPAAVPAGGVSTGAMLPSMPEVDFSQFGEVEEQDLGRIKKLSGAHLHRAWLNVPHVTQFDEADITELEAFRKEQKEAAAKRDIKLTFMPFLMQALAKAMGAYPQFNSSLSSDGERLVLKKYVHIGVAVDTPKGLVVPVVRDVDRKSVFDIAADLADLSARARSGKLTPGDMQGGCISISSLGGIGGSHFTPIVNVPEVAILGVSRAQMQPRWDGAEFRPRLIMPFSLSYDHRVIDGAEGVRFTTYLGQLLGDIRRLLL